MAFERFHTRFNPTATANVATPKRIKNYLMRFIIYPMPCFTTRKVTNSYHTPPKRNHN